jgi:hypothetical protein
MEFLKIVGLGLGAAVGYGILHDQVTARICVEYFTVGHPPLIASTSPTLLALAWGVVATWWVGLPLGLVLAVAARAGRRPRTDAATVAPRVLKLLAVMASCAFLAGLVGYLLAEHGPLTLVGEWGDVVPYARQSRFLADLWAHNASYLSGILGGVFVVVVTFQRRLKVPGGAA